MDGTAQVMETKEVNSQELRLIERIRAGEKALFHELITPYERSVYLLAYSVLQNQEDAEEVAQETMLRAFANLNQLRSDTKFKSWLLTIAINEARLRRRKERKHLYESLDGEQPGEDQGEFMPRDLADWREIPSEALERKEIRHAVSQALRRLPTKYREAFLLRDVQHLGVEETAQALGVSVAAAKTRTHRARLQMREELAPYCKRRWTDRLPFRKGTKPW